MIPFFKRFEFIFDFDFEWIFYWSMYKKRRGKIYGRVGGVEKGAGRTHVLLWRADAELGSFCHGSCAETEFGPIRRR